MQEVNAHLKNGVAPGPLCETNEVRRLLFTDSSYPVTRLAIELELFLMRGEVVPAFWRRTLAVGHQLPFRKVPKAAMPTWPELQLLQDLLPGGADVRVPLVMDLTKIGDDEEAEQVQARPILVGPTQMRATCSAVSKLHRPYWRELHKKHWQMCYEPNAAEIRFTSYIWRWR